MPIVLAVLGGVCWRGRPVVGERPQALLAGLVLAGGQTVPGERLAEAVWGEDAPANTGKALQVLISRTRAFCGPEAVVRDGRGYRLGVPPEEVDALRLGELSARARRLLAADDPGAAHQAATEAMALAESLVTPGDEDDHPLARIRRDAAAHRDEAAGLLGRALSLTGDHAAALPGLVAAFERDPSDEAVLACLLRSEAAVRGTGAALDRYQTYREGLRTRLGADPGVAVERVHRELLHLDKPVRVGLQYDASALIGRSDDIRQLRALVNNARVVSIVGAGGLGKTRLAHVLGRSADQPVVHFVGLVGVSAPDDLIAEVGSALGVRDSVHGRRSWTTRQLAELRERIARHLGSAPGLLILDNCEHLIDAVAEFVAFLIATTDDLRVVTTSRAPLAISAERVYLLGALGTAESADLFRQRAVAARPDVRLPDDVVTDIVTRLDGLPLAIELAAAKARVMSVEEIGRRLEDRFALLRGGVRDAPDRHRTLAAVIDWSWNLLADGERRALRRLSVFPDGFTLAAAEEVLGRDALGAVQGLVDQSLLTVAETGAGVRYRMLETVREFGRMRLAEAGDQKAALAARREWATCYARTAAQRLFSPDQFAAVDALDAEETNLADELRQALTSDPEAVVLLLCGLGGLWSIRGEHTRLAVLGGTIGETVSGWYPPPELVDATRAAMTVVLQNGMIGASESTLVPVRDLLVRLGSDDSGDRQANAAAKVLLACFPPFDEASAAQLEELTASADPDVALAATQWRSHQLENAGDPVGAVEAAERALTMTRPSVEGPWRAAILHTHLAGLHMQLGNPEAALPHIPPAIPVLERLGALDDLLQLRAVLALCAIHAGRLDEAVHYIGEAGRIPESDGLLSSQLVLGAVRAELALARGDLVTGLAAYREAAARLRAFVFPGHERTGGEPWRLFGDAGLLAALAYHGTDGDEAEGTELFRSCRDTMSRLLRADDPLFDYPAFGAALFAVGVWGLLRSALPAPAAVRLLVLAERFGYTRMVPTMAWEKIAPFAEERAPGCIAAFRAEYGDRRPADLVEEAQRLVDQIG